MAQVINTNIASLNAQRNLNTSQTALATSLQRLSSGLRINSAKDDAAGLAISERFTTQIRGLNQAIRNSNDGISLAQTGEGSLAEITQNLQRIRELAVQSANATNSTSDRAALDLEVSQRLAEVERIASQTSFNGRKILDGTFGNAAFQVGANVGETITVDLATSMKLDSIGQIATATSTGVGAAITEGSDAVATTSTASGTFTQATSGAGSETWSMTVGGVTVYTTTSAGAGENVTAADIDGGLAAATAALTGAGISYTGSFTNGNLVFTKADGTDFDIAVSTYATGTPGGFAGADFADGTNSVTNGTPAVTAVPLTLGTGDLTIQLGTGTAVGIEGTFNTSQELADAINAAAPGVVASVDGSDELVLQGGEDITIGGAQAGALGLTSATVSGDLTAVTVTSVASANETILRMDAALTSVSTLRSTFGAIQNRFESTISNLSATAENLTASRSRIQDADFAAETAQLTRAQILQQAGVAMLAQANALPNNVLSLLR